MKYMQLLAVSSLQTVLEEKCSALLKEKEVLFAGIIGKNGKLVSGGFKAEIKLVDEVEREMMFMEHVLMANMNRDFDGSLGRVLYGVLKREKTTLISFSIGAFLFLAAVDPSSDVDRTTNKIRQTLSTFVLNA